MAGFASRFGGHDRPVALRYETAADHDPPLDAQLASKHLRCQGRGPEHSTGAVAAVSTMKTITPRDFRNAFVEVMKSEQANFRAAVTFEAKSFTYFMRSNIFPKLARRLELLAWTRDYYALDGMFYEERGRDNAGKFTTYAKWISVALEHATRPSRTHEEINKLQMFNAPLKVLITYVTEGAETEALLGKYEAVISDADVFNDIATLRKQLVILGSPQAVGQWRFYVYESDGFVLMLP